MSSTTDVLANVEARALLRDLDTRGVRLIVRRGHVAANPADLVTDADRACIRQHRCDLLVLLLVSDERTIDRLLVLRSGERPTSVHGSGCYQCGDPLPPDRPIGRCGWCGLAARLNAGGRVPPDVLGLFDETIRGPVRLPLAGLAHDLRQPA